MPLGLTPSFDSRSLTSFDGTRIAYYVTSEPAGAPVVVLANGLGGPRDAWRALVSFLGDRLRFVTWDYRGLYGSGRPPVDRPASYAIANHVRDLEAIMRAEATERAALVGWSMGVQVVLETVRQAPSLATALVLLNGTFGRPLDTLSPIPGVKAVLPSLVELATKMHALATQMTRRAREQPEALAWLKRLGLVGPTLDQAVFEELIHSFGQLDMQTYFYNLRAIGEHDASAVLSAVRAPTLVITGEHDAFTPPSLAQEMARRIRNAELLVVRGGTHYTAVEYPELVNLRVERFLRAQGVLDGSGG